MKHCVKSTWPGRARKAWPLFSVLLIPALASEVGRPSIAAATAEDSIPLGTTGPSRPYLQYLGPPPLRFEDAPPPPDLSVRPVAGASPIPGLASDEPATKSASTSPSPGAAAPTPVAVKSDPVEAHPSDSAPTAGIQPSPILPDETKQRVRPEDFLPFFQFPGGHSAPEAETPGAIPPSSATYKQQ